ncbi:MAG: hypothetical protein AABM30_09865 [Actinomycetota bacterium]
MKRLLVLASLVALTLPAAAIAKGPSEASITGPGLGKAITITGPEEEGSPLMSFAEQAGFFPAAFGQEPDPLLPGRPKGDLGPKYKIAYTVPGPENDSFDISQDLYPYASPSAVTYMPEGQEIFDSTTHGGWFESPLLKDTLVAAGLPKTAAAAARDSSSAGFFSTGKLGALIVVLLLLGAATIAMRRRFSRDAAA